jgi:hypothetical protein
MTTEMLTDIGGIPVELPPYSLYLASCAFRAFPMPHHELQQKFCTETEVKLATSAALDMGLLYVLR